MSIEVEVSVGLTVSAGNYESIRVDLRERRVSEEGEETSTREKMREQLQKELVNAIQDMRKTYAKATGIFDDKDLDGI